MRPVRVLLTGASGFVGSHAAPALLERGQDLSILVRSTDKARRVLAGRGVELDGDRVRVVEGDMTDADAVGRAADGCAATVRRILRRAAAAPG